MRLWFCFGLAACSGTTADEPDPTDEGVLRVVFIADTHVIGPQYTCCSESDGVDNASIMRTPERLEHTIQAINAIEPPPDHVFLVGDVVHDAHHSDAIDWYTGEENAFSRAATLLGQLNAPLHIVWGNHDYEVECGGGTGHYEREFTHSLFQHFFQANPYDQVETDNWRFAMLNSQLGPTWDALGPDCQTGVGSYGEEQLAWLDGALSDDKPTVVLSHHHMITATSMHENDGPHPSLSAVLSKHDNVAVHMAGHLHRWYDLLPTDSHPVRHIILGATRYDTDNFWLAEFHPNGEFELLDYDKPQWLTTCADTWSYDGTPTPMPEAIEDGDCSP